MARKGVEDKEGIQSCVERAFGYRLGESLHDLRIHYGLDATCNGSVPHAIKAFLESESFEDAIGKAVAVGGDSDTIACMAGGIAQAFYGGVPQEIAEPVKARLDERLNRVVSEFMIRYALPGNENGSGSSSLVSRLRNSLKKFSGLVFSPSPLSPPIEGGEA